MKNDTEISHSYGIMIGKDILELVSSAMYVDPLTIFREFVQNAADSVDIAKATGVLEIHERGKLDITLDFTPLARSVKLRDNGVGVSNSVFFTRMTAIGGSQKRGTQARGFRGIGRLAGLGYCQELVFRSRSINDTAVHELRWNCRMLKQLLIDHTYCGDIYELIRKVTTLNILDSDCWPEHFFEVELVKPIRIKNDLLLNSDAISFYLSQVAPVPFSPEFKFGAEIRSYLNEHLGDIGEIEICIDNGLPIYRPYRNDYAYNEDKRDNFTKLEFRVIESINGVAAAAVIWILHHGYFGAIPRKEGVGGLRARKGNMQIGDHRIFIDIFPETRFANWTVGEVHIVDDHVVPNGRRDDFEQNSHYGHLQSRLTELGDYIGHMCRSSSVIRNRIKMFDIGVTKIDENLRILEQGAVNLATSEAIIKGIRSEMLEIKKITEAGVLDESDRTVLYGRCSSLENRFSIIQSYTEIPEVFSGFSENDRAIIKKIISLIYECSANRVVAKLLVDKILSRL
ncbi:MAG: ATP-binding protein [Magnetococcus sp. DMHC-1]